MGMWASLKNRPVAHYVSLYHSYVTAAVERLVSFLHIDSLKVTLTFTHLADALDLQVRQLRLRCLAKGHFSPRTDQRLRD